VFDPWLKLSMPARFGGQNPDFFASSTGKNHFF
jgi:hypothetical protein